MKLCVKWGNSNTSWHINVNYVEIFFAYTWGVKLNIMGKWKWGIYGLNGLGMQLWKSELLFLEDIYAQNHWSSMNSY